MKKFLSWAMMVSVIFSAHSKQVGDKGITITTSDGDAKISGITSGPVWQGIADEFTKVEDAITAVKPESVIDHNTIFINEKGKEQVSARQLADMRSITVSSGGKLQVNSDDQWKYYDFIIDKAADSIDGTAHMTKCIFLQGYSKLGQCLTGVEIPYEYSLDDQSVPLDERTWYAASIRPYIYDKSIVLDENFHDGKPTQCIQVSHKKPDYPTIWTYYFAPYVNTKGHFTFRMHEGVQQKYNIQQADITGTGNQHPYSARYSVRPDQKYIISESGGTLSVDMEKMVDDKTIRVIDGKFFVPQLDIESIVDGETITVRDGKICLNLVDELHSRKIESKQTQPQQHVSQKVHVHKHVKK